MKRKLLCYAFALNAFLLIPDFVSALDKCPPDAAGGKRASNQTVRITKHEHDRAIHHLHKKAVQQKKNKRRTQLIRRNKGGGHSICNQRFIQ